MIHFSFICEEKNTSTILSHYMFSTYSTFVFPVSKSRTFFFRVNVWSRMFVLAILDIRGLDVVKV